MCLIEELGYSAANREQYCTECVIFNKIGECAYLRQSEANANTLTHANANNIGSGKLILKTIHLGDESCVCKKELK